MAKIVLGIGASHSPMVITEPEWYPAHGERDRRSRELWGLDAKAHTFSELVADEKLRAGTAHITAMLEKDRWDEHHARTTKAIDELARVYADAKPDVVVIVGDDQEELFHEDNMPAMAIFYGEKMHNLNYYASAPRDSSFKAASWAYGDVRDVPVQSDLAEHIIYRLVKEEFDITRVKYLREKQGMGHAFGFVVDRIMGDGGTPIVPVLLNTYYPPNTPSVKRCFNLGEEIGKAIEKWDKDVRVAVVASGGLSHFVVAEEWDRAVLKALEDNDKGAIKGLPDDWMGSGNSEIKNWITAAGALHDSGLKYRTVDYIANYRTEAGTGGGWGFGYWA